MSSTPNTATAGSVNAPSIDRLSIENPGETSFMRHVATTVPGATPRVAAAWAPLETIAPLFVAAAVKCEDPRFFEHRGVDFVMIKHVVRGSIRNRKIVGGASTITQQLARNLYLTPRRSIVRKLREMGLAWRIERRLSKARILELYLNLVEWGGGAWGCVAAGAHYFGKSPRDLDLFESTFLMSLLPAPRAGLSGRHAQRSQQSQLWTTASMLLSGLADPEACAICRDRVKELQRLLASGLPLAEALAGSARVTTSPDAAFLRRIATALDIAPVPPAAIFASHCGYAQQRLVSGRLRARFGGAAVQQVLASGGNLSALKAHANAPRAGG
jgi:monofunctional biosynthetic peptidoglycan transglycosylase